MYKSELIKPDLYRDIDGGVFYYYTGNMFTSNIAEIIPIDGMDYCKLACLDGIFDFSTFKSAERYVIGNYHHLYATSAQYALDHPEEQ